MIVNDIDIKILILLVWCGMWLVWWVGFLN